MGRIQVCFVVTPVQYEVGQFFFPVYFPTSFKNQNIVFKKKTVLLKLLKVTATLRRNPPSKDSLQKMSLGNLSFFLHSITLFLKNETQINKNNYATMLFMSKQVNLPKIGSILQKMKITPKSDICPFCMKSFNSFSALGNYSSFTCIFCL